MWTLECDGDILQGIYKSHMVQMIQLCNMRHRKESLATSGEEISLRSDESRWW